MSFVKVLFKIILSLVLICFICVVNSDGRAYYQDRETFFKSAKVLADCRDNINYAVHDIGKIGMTVSNTGTIGQGFLDWMGASLPGYAPSCVYPYPGNQEYLYAGALWIGAIVGEDTLVSVGADAWNPVIEMWPAAAPDNEVIERSILNPDDSDAISDQDIIAVFVDTVTDYACVDQDPVDNRPHIPLNLRIEQRSYAWSYSYADDFIIFDYSIENIGTNTLEDVYMGIYIDGDVGKQGVYDEAQDDICGFRRSVPSIYDCPGEDWEDTLNIAWIADNDGRNADTDIPCPTFSWPHVTGIRVLKTPNDSLQYSFNWWISNSDTSQDFGPRQAGTAEDPFRDFGGFLGTPEGDHNKYYIMSHEEFDYDQLFTAVDHSAEGWLPPPTTAFNLADGFDTRYLLSFGPFNIDPGEILPITFAYVAGEDFHTDCEAFGDLFDPSSPDAYSDYLNFENFGRNAMWASWIYDNPGVDTDGDGFAGFSRMCGESQVYVSGDGVPDFRAASPPPAPTVRLQAEGSQIKVRWNGLNSETTYDYFSHRIDFEGYRIYSSFDSVAGSFAMIATYDLEDFYKYAYNVDTYSWEIVGPPMTPDEIYSLYGISNPLDYIIGTPFVWGDSVFYFEPIDFNESDLVDTTKIHKVYPAQPYPSTLIPDSADPYELTDEGYFKYFEYEYIINNVLENTRYYISCTAFDFGSPGSDLISMLETKPILSAVGITTPPMSDVADEDNTLLPDKLTLHQNYPNPFNPSTNISFELPSRKEVELTIYNLLGQMVKHINLGERNAGIHNIMYDGTDREGNSLASGVYFYQLKAGGQTMAKKMILMK